jgi:hypothetical protein
MILRCDYGCFHRAGSRRHFADCYLTQPSMDQLTTSRMRSETRALPSRHHPRHAGGLIGGRHAGVSSLRRICCPGLGIDSDARRAKALVRTAARRRARRLLQAVSWPLGFAVSHRRGRADVETYVALARCAAATGTGSSPLLTTWVMTASELRRKLARLGCTFEDGTKHTIIYFKGADVDAPPPKP